MELRNATDKEVVERVGGSDKEAVERVEGSPLYFFDARDKFETRSFLQLLG